MLKIVNKSSSECLCLAVDSLKAGGMVMHPTETCYGFAVDVFNKEALDRIYLLKGRDFNKPVSILVDSLGMALNYGIFSDKAFELAERYWPGALSIVVPRRKELPSFLNPEDDYISIRYSSDDFCTSLVERFGGPITTTSANVSGQDPLYMVDLSVFGEKAGLIDLVVDGGKISDVRPSTVARVEGDFVQILRQGEVEV
jgi:L-threonylcarbamoyladenylate synthase